jgi:hypothetical protein
MGNQRKVKSRFIGNYRTRQSGISQIINEIEEAGWKNIRPPHSKTRRALQRSTRNAGHIDIGLGTDADSEAFAS